VGATPVDPNGWQGRRLFLLLVFVLLVMTFLATASPVPAMCMPSQPDGCTLEGYGMYHCCYTDRESCATSCRWYNSPWGIGPFVPTP